MWRWWAKESIALESVIAFGVREGTRATPIINDLAIRLDDICGIATIEDDIFDQIMNWPVSEQD